jgi:adenylate cyclase
LERKLAAILCADVYGYSRLIGEDEEATLRTLTSHRRLIDSQIERHHGRFVNSAGDKGCLKMPRRMSGGTKARARRD